MKYAVIKTGGKQYTVSEGDKIQVEKIPGVVGQALDFTRVLLVGGDGEVKMGAPVLDQAKVAGEIVAQIRGTKLAVFKKKRRKGYSKKTGHRQELTEVVIKEILA